MPREQAGVFSIPPHQTKLYHLFLCLCAGDQQASCGFPEPCPVEIRKGSKGSWKGHSYSQAQGPPSLSNSLKKGQEPLAISPACPQEGCRCEHNLEHRQDSREEEAAAAVVAEVRKFPKISPKEELLVCWVRVGAGGSQSPPK